MNPSTKLKSKIDSIVKLENSLTWPKYFNAGPELPIDEQIKLKARLDVLKRQNAQDTETEIQDLLISQPQRKSIGLMGTRHDNEVPAEMVLGKKPKKKRLTVLEELRMNHMLLVNEQRSRYQEFGSNNYLKTDANDQKKKIEFTLLFRKRKCMFMFVLFSIATLHYLLRFYVTSFGPGGESLQNSSIETYCEAFDRLRCENGGYPVDTGHGFTCKCTDDYYGELCTYETFSSVVFRCISALFDSLNMDLRRGTPRMWWSFLPFTSDLQQTKIISFYQEQMERMQNGFTSDGNGAITFTRILPTGRPLHCPVKNGLPPLDTVYDKIFRRKHDGGLKWDPKRRNILFHTFYQYFILQFFHTDFNSTVTGSQLYGADETTRRELKSFVGGKLKTEQHLNNEHYPPRLSLTKKFSAVFSRMWSSEPTRWFDRVAADAKSRDNNKRHVHHRWAMGHPLLSMNPALFAMHTLWMREHNRVCDELAGQLKTEQWTDDRLYNAAKRIVVGEMMVIMMNEVLNADGNTGWLQRRYDPGVHRTSHPVRVVDNFSTPLEMLLTMMMPSGTPDEFGNADKAYSMLFGDNSQVLENGMGDAVRFMVEQMMGMLSSNNDGAATEPLTKVLMKMSRENAVQSFNSYRTHLGLHAYGGFYELTGNRETAEKLESLYENVGDVEMLVGMLTEKKIEGTVPTFTVMMNSFIVNSIVTNPLYSKTMWTSDTFDGDYGFSIVKSANIKTFICNNLHDECDNDDFIVNFYAE